jgi:16S rRNA (uracil1498-N3)-methyltransferase
MSTTPRFFVPPEAIIEETAVLPPGVLHHAGQVLRLRPGEPIILHDGNGFAYEATMGAGKSATVRISRRYALDTEPVLRITIAQALPKTSEKAEQILQHGTEIGATGFLFFPSERSVARLEAGDKIEKRLRRWSEIVKSAAEQSRRGRIPTIEWEPRFAPVGARLSAFDRALILHESATVPLRQGFSPDSAPDSPTCCLFVGPEGGFTHAEVSSLAEAGGRAVHLGPRILRTETAALVGLSQLLFAWELHCERTPPP